MGGVRLVIVPIGLRYTQAGACLIFHDETAASRRSLSSDEADHGELLGPSDAIHAIIEGGIRSQPSYFASLIRAIAEDENKGLCTPIGSR